MALSAALPIDWPPVLVYFGVTVILSLRGWTSLARQTRWRSVVPLAIATAGVSAGSP